MDIELQILAIDIESIYSSYMDADECAITRALQRTGYSYRHVGSEIRTNNNDYEVQEVIFNYKNSNLLDLEHIVWSMYKRQLKPEDFLFKLIKQ